MFSLELFRDLLGHMEWADARVWQAVMALPGAADGKVRDLLLHSHTTQRAFLYIWTDQPMQFPQAEEFPTPRDLQMWARPYYAEAARYLETLTAGDLSQPITLPWKSHFEGQFGRPLQTTTRGETLFQVMSHSIHHRGQVNMRLRELGAEPPLVDYIAWIWFGRPAAEWV